MGGRERLGGTAVREVKRNPVASLNETMRKGWEAGKILNEELQKSGVSADTKKIMRVAFEIIENSSSDTPSRDKAKCSLKELAKQGGRRGEYIIKRLIRDLRAEDFDVTYDASDTLIQIGEPAISPLIKLYKENKFGLREDQVLSAGERKFKDEILHVLAGIGRPAVKELLKQ
jgi:HEAT repeat protein